MHPKGSGNTEGVDPDIPSSAHRKKLKQQTNDRQEPRHPNHFIDPEMPGSTKKRRYSPPRTSAQTHKSVRLKAGAQLNLGAARAIQQSMPPPLQQQVRRQAENETVDS
jgi:hypothetical protein